MSTSSGLTRLLLWLCAGAVCSQAGAASITIASLGTTTPFQDPQKNNTIGGYTVSQLVADPLVDFDGKTYQPALATKWTASSNGLTYTFTLRPGVKFQSGRPLTAAAVKASIERIINPKAPLPAAGQLGSIQSVTAVNPSTLKITLKAPDPEFLLNLGGAWIIDPATASAEAPQGTGPFKITEYRNNQRIVFSPNASYWGGKPKLDQIIFREIPDSSTMTLELEAGTVDLAMFTPAKDVKRLSNQFNTLRFGAVNLAFIALNNKTVPQPVRKAVCMAVDRNVLLKNVYADLGEPATTIALPDGWAHNAQLAGYKFDPAAARKVLEDAGYTLKAGQRTRAKDGKPLVLNFQARGDGEWLLATQAIQQMLGDVGIGSTISPNERATYYSNVRTGKYDLGWWIDNAQPQPPIYAYAFGSKEYWNVTQAPRKDLDELLKAGQSTSKQSVRAAAYQKLERQVYEDAVQCPQFWIKQAHLANKKLTGIKTNTLGTLLDAANWSVK